MLHYKIHSEKRTKMQWKSVFIAIDDQPVTSTCQHHRLPDFLSDFSNSLAFLFVGFYSLIFWLVSCGKLSRQHVTDIDAFEVQRDL